MKPSFVVAARVLCAAAVLLLAAACAGGSEPSGDDLVTTVQADTDAALAQPIPPVDDEGGSAGTGAAAADGGTVGTTDGAAGDGSTVVTAAVDAARPAHEGEEPAATGAEGAGVVVTAPATVTDADDDVSGWVWPASSVWTPTRWWPEPAPERSIQVPESFESFEDYERWEAGNNWDEPARWRVRPVTERLGEPVFDSTGSMWVPWPAYEGPRAVQISGNGTVHMSWEQAGLAYMEAARELWEHHFPPYNERARAAIAAGEPVYVFDGPRAGWPQLDAGDLPFTLNWNEDRTDASLTTRVCQPHPALDVFFDPAMYNPPGADPARVRRVLDVVNDLPSGAGHAFSAVLHQPGNLGGPGANPNYQRPLDIEHYERAIARASGVEVDVKWLPDAYEIMVTGWPDDGSPRFDGGHLTWDQAVGLPEGDFAAAALEYLAGKLAMDAAIWRLVRETSNGPLPTSLFETCGDMHSVLNTAGNSTPLENIEVSWSAGHRSYSNYPHVADVYGQYIETPGRAKTVRCYPEIYDQAVEPVTGTVVWHRVTPERAVAGEWAYDDGRYRFAGDETFEGPCTPGEGGAAFEQALAWTKRSRLPDSYPANPVNRWFHIDQEEAWWAFRDVSWDLQRRCAAGVPHGKVIDGAFEPRVDWLCTPEQWQTIETNALTGRITS